MNMLEVLLFHKPEMPPQPAKRTPDRSPAYGTVQPRLLAYLKDHPDSTPAEMRAALNLNRFSVDRALRTLNATGRAEITKPAVQCGKVRSAATWRAK